MRISSRMPLKRLSAHFVCIFVMLIWSRGPVPEWWSGPRSAGAGLLSPCLPQRAHAHHARASTSAAASLTGEFAMAQPSPGAHGG